MGVLRLTSRPHIYVGELEANGTRLTNPRRLTRDEYSEWPARWTPDSRSAVFWSERDGKWDIFKQALEQNADLEMLPLGTEPKWYMSFSPDGLWILYMALSEAQFPGGSVPVRIMRVPISGGAPQLVLTASGTTDLRCTRPPANLCVFDEQRENHQVFTSFDPVKGRGRELAKIETEPSMTRPWDLSPDGTRLAILANSQKDVGNNNGARIRLVSLANEATKDLVVPGSHNLCGADWSAAGDALLVCSYTTEGSVLLRVNLAGEAKPLWPGQLSILGTKAVPSPDGRHLAFADWSIESNAWVLEGF